MTLTEFLLARIAEQQAEAEKIKAAIDADPGAFASIVHDHPELAAGDCAGWLADYDPTRVLAECETKRRIVEGAAAWLRGAGYQPTKDAMGITLRRLATVYADHADYDESWRP